MKRITSILLVAAIIMSIFVLPASASEVQTITEHFVDDERTEISASVKSGTVAKTAPAISGYEYKSQSTETTHIYTEEHIAYIVGYPDGGVKAENNMTRAEAVTVLYRLYNGKYPAHVQRMSSSAFSDVSSTDWFYREVEALYNAGVIESSADGRFRPNDPITRAEFAVMCTLYDGLR